MLVPGIEAGKPAESNRSEGWHSALNCKSPCSYGTTFQGQAGKHGKTLRLSLGGRVWAGAMSIPEIWSFLKLGHTPEIKRLGHGQGEHRVQRKLGGGGIG